LLFKIA